MFRGIALQDLLHSFDGGELAGNGGVTSLSSLHEPFRRRVINLMGQYLHNQATVLSVGCGDGFMEADLAARGHDVIALDLRPTVAQSVTTRGVPFAQADAHRLPIADRTIDAVLLSESIGQIDPEAGLKEVARVLRLGGLVALTTYPVLKSDDSSVRTERFVFSGTLDWNTTPEVNTYCSEYRKLSHYHLYPPQLLKLFLQQAGFRVMHLKEEIYYSSTFGEAGIVIAVGVLTP